MRYATSRVRATSKPSKAPDSDNRAHSIRFGDILFHMTEEPRWPGLTDAARRSLKRLPHATQRQRLHIVVQKGRLFQQEHPDVPVLLDKGRYLVVDLDRRKARSWDKKSRPCFAIRPLSETDVAFDTRAAPRPRGPALPWVQTIVDRITRASFEASLQELVALPTRFSTSSHYAAAAGSARAQLDQLGFSTRLQTVTVGGASSSNVIAEKPGAGPMPRNVVIVSAHLDSINLSGGPTAPAPGADDDGSGCAGVLSIARAIKHHKAAHDLRLILFGGEEQGLLGSQRYVNSLSVAERKRIHAVVNMDMIATLNTTQPSVLLEGATLSESVIDGLLEAAATYTQLKVQTSLHAYNSDHVSFLNANIPAVLTIEGTDDANKHIHSANDTLEHINFDLALDILRMNVAFVAQAIGQIP